MARPQRLPLRYLVGAYLEAAPKLAASLVAGAIYVLSPGLWPGPWAWLAIGPLVAVTIAEPVWRRSFTRLTLSDRYLTVARGVLRRREVTLRWSEVGAVDIRRSWAFRMCGAYAVTIAQAGDDRAKIDIPGVDDAMRMQLLALAGRFGHEQVPEGSALPSSSYPVDAQVETRSGEPLYTVRVADLLVASLVYGQFAVIGVLAALAAWQVLDLLGMDGMLAETFRSSPVLTLCVVGAAIVVVGFAITVVRYAGFEVSRAADGQVTIRYGLISTHSRTIDSHATVGVVLQRNFVEMVLGRVRLALLTNDSTMQLGANLVLPSLPRGVVLQLLRVGFEDWTVTEALAATHGIRSIVRSAALLATTMAVPVAVWHVSSTTRLPVWGRVLLCLAALLVGWALGRVLCSRLTVDGGGDLVILTTLHIIDRQRILRDTALHVVSAVQPFGRPLFVSAHYYAGMPRALSAFRFRVADVDAVRARVGAHAPLVAAERRRRRHIQL